jgi:hypothetical protein
MLKETAGRFKSSGGTGKRSRPSLATTISLETDEALRAYSRQTGVPIGKIIDRAVASYLKEVRK